MPFSIDIQILQNSNQYLIRKNRFNQSFQFNRWFINSENRNAYVYLPLCVLLFYRFHNNKHKSWTASKVFHHRIDTFQNANKKVSESNKTNSIEKKQQKNLPETLRIDWYRSMPNSGQRIERISNRTIHGHSWWMLSDRRGWKEKKPNWKKKYNWFDSVFGLLTFVLAVISTSMHIHTLWSTKSLLFCYVSIFKKPERQTILEPWKFVRVYKLFSLTK